MIFNFLLIVLVLGFVDSRCITRYNTRPSHIKDDVAGVAIKNSNIVSDYVTKWEGGIVPYKINETFTFKEKSLILQSLKVIEVQTKNCIKFVEYNNNNQYVAWLHFLEDNGCWSWIGRGKGEQWLSLAPGCLSQSTIIHETLHALGFWHEQSRPDRDNYITINWSNILYGYESEFFSRPDVIDTMGMPYDYFSIMHYKYNTFAVYWSIPTMTPKNPIINMYQMGIRNDLSDIDIEKIKKYYSCNN